MKNKKQKKPSIWGIILCMYALGMLTEFIPSDMGLTEILPIVILVIIVAIAIVASKAVKKKIGEDYPRSVASLTQEELFEHSHDRVSAKGTVVRHTPQEEWKLQLDGFLQAGLIDKAEYKVLWEKHLNDKPIDEFYERRG